MASLLRDASTYTVALEPYEPRSKQRRRLRISPRFEPYLMVAPVVILFLGLIGAPIVILIRYSLLDNVIVNQHPKFVGIANYTSLLSSGVSGPQSSTH